MRDGLTFLAGLVLLALLGALAAPAFVDWSQQRAFLEEQLRRATGLTVVTTGPLHLRLLPTPRIKITGLRIGEADPQETRIGVGTVRAELELGPLLRGDLRLADLQLDNVDVTVAIRDGAAVLPQSLSSASIPGVERLSITRGQIRLVREGGTTISSMPFRAEASWPRIQGPARIEGEIAGRSVRLTTGDRDGTGRTRVKFSSVDSVVRADFDGWVGLDHLANQRIALRPDGQLVASLVRTAPDSLTASATGRLLGTATGLTLGPLAIDLGGAGRLDGDASWTGDWQQPLQVNLGSRRADIGAWVDQVRSLGPLELIPDWLAGALPPLRLRLTADQVSYRGEEGTEAQVVALFTASGWQPESGQLRAAGATASFRQRSTTGFAASVAIPDMRRIALAMQRLDMPQGLAEDIAALGQLNATADLTRLGTDWRIDDWRLSGRFGEANGTGSISPDVVSLRGGIRYTDILFLVRPLSALATLVPQTLKLSLAGEALRMAASPAGSGTMEATRAAGGWRLDRIDARGFDGLDLKVEQGDGASRLAFSVSAARSDAIGQLVERLGGSASVTHIVRALRGTSPLRLNGVAEERDGDWLLSATGQAGPLSVETSARFASSGTWLGGDVSLASPERNLLFRALGLPEPASGRVATRAAARFGQAGPTLVIAGADGLAVEARGRWLANQPGVLDGPLAVTFLAPSIGTVLPAFGMDRGLEGRLEGKLAMRLAEDLISLGDITASFATANSASASQLSGTIDLASSGTISGDLKLPAFDLGAIGGWLAGGPIVAADGNWSSARFAEARRIPVLQLDLSSDRITVPLADIMRGALRLETGEGVVRMSRVRLSSGTTSLTGNLELERAGTQLSVRGSAEVAGVDLARTLGGDVSGTGTVTVQLGAAGESPARLAAALTGSVRFDGQNLVIARFDPSALPRIAQFIATDISTPDAQRLAQSVRQSVEAASWRLNETSLTAIIAAGVARLTPVSEDRAQSSLSLSGTLDMRTGVADLRSSMLMKTPPNGWTGPAPQINLSWRGPWRQTARSYDVSALSNAVSQRALQREIERVEAYEADIRERAQFNRRLRAERERREEEQRQAAAEAQRQAVAEAQRVAAEAERRAAAEAARREEERQRNAAQILAPPLPPPISISPVPLPRQLPTPDGPPPALNLNPVLRPLGAPN